MTYDYKPGGLDAVKCLKLRTYVSGNGLSFLELEPYRQPPDLLRTGRNYLVMMYVTYYGSRVALYSF